MSAGAENMSDEPGAGSLELVLELALHEEEGLADRANWLDTKTGAVLGFVIVSIAELLGFLFLASAEHPGGHRIFTIAHPYLTAVLFSIGLMAIVAAMISGLFELAPMGFSYGTSTEFLASQVDKPSSEIRAQCVNALRSTSVRNRAIVQEKAKLVKVTVFCVGVALLCYAAAVATLFFSLL